MALQLDQKFSTFANGGPVVIGDIIVGLRGGINTKFTFDAGVTTVQGTLNQVLVNNSVGVPVAGPIVLSTPQDIATTSSPTFNALTLSTASAFRLLAGGITTGNPLQSVVEGTTGQLLQSNGAAALPTWTAAAFPVGPGTLNHLLRSDGTNWVETTATTIDAADVMSGLTQLNVDNLRLDGNTISATDLNGNINLINSGTSNVNIGSTTNIANGYSLQVASSGLQTQIVAAQYTNDGSCPTYYSFKSRATTVGSHAAISSGDSMGRWAFYGDDGTNFVVGGSILFKCADNVSLGVMPTEIQIFTTNSSGVQTHAMTLDKDQKLLLEHALSSLYGGTGVNNGTSTITLGGSLTTSGAFSSTFTMTANTSVTFPTSGTLATTAGTVSSVSGTANRITSTGGTTPVIDISASYVGQSSITTLGTVTTGVWNGTTIVVANGGTGIATATAYGLIAGGTTATGNFQSIATGTAGQHLTSGGAAALPTWTTATFPSTSGTSGTILRSNGTNWVNSTSTFADTYGASTLLYSNGANTVTGLATANNGLLVTNGSGVPSIGNTIGASISVTGQVTATTGVNHGVLGNTPALNTFYTSSSNAQSYQILKWVTGSSASTFLQITVPAAPYFITIECFIANSRAQFSAVGTSLLEKRWFTIGRNGSGSDVVLDAATALNMNFTSTTAGGSQNATSGATTIVRNGAEANTLPQVVNITIDPETTTSSGGNAAIWCTIIVLGSTSGLVIT